MGFEEWLRNYESEYEKALKKWQDKGGYKSIIPKGFSEKILKQYMAYRIEMETKKLVRATWALAIVTIILSFITLMLK